MLASAGAIYGVGASSAFDYARLQVDGAEYTDLPAAEEAVAGARGENLFRLSTEPLEDRARGAADGRPGQRRRPAAGDPGGDPP